MLKRYSIGWRRVYKKEFHKLEKKLLKGPHDNIEVFVMEECNVF